MAHKKKQSGKKPFLWVSGAILIGAGGAFAAMYSRYQPQIPPGVTFEGQSLAGKTKDQAQRVVEVWWDSMKSQKIRMTSKTLLKNPDAMSAADLGVSCDINKTLANVHVEDFGQYLMRQLGQSKSKLISVIPQFKVDSTKTEFLTDFVADNAPEKQKAKAEFEGGKVVTTPEISTVELDTEALPKVLETAISKGEVAEIPLKKAKVAITEEDLAQIKDVIGEYTSRYSEGNANRASNIRNAAQRLSGTVILPGETFSFNKVLGQRTAKNGFKLAGVYNNGKHDFDIGGGICQVSGTLYNAVLLGNLQIVSRSNHTFPVPYLPVGRDATVSFPAPDFAFKNSTGKPIAISVRAGGGSITFRVLGIKEPGLDVKVETSGHSSWSLGEKVINDPSLPPGKRFVEEPGGAGHRINTFRVVYRNGAIEKRENLGTSYYNGGVRVVRQNLSAPKPDSTTTVEKPVDNEDPNGAKPVVEPPTKPANLSAKPPKKPKILKP